ncbi:MAG: hypothetical protein PHI06_04155 [Desulfobulbaceae bacterium]|nr:hypothetical protein [Desulfobulbaceae bacterium]
MPKVTYPNIFAGVICAAIVVLVSFPLYILFYLDPAFAKFVTVSSEREAVKVANHIAAALFPGGSEFSETSISVSKEQLLSELQRDFQIIKVKIFKPDGTIIYSTDKPDIGEVNTHDYFRDVVAHGQLYTKIVQKNTISMEGQIMPIDVVETYVPMMYGVTFVGAFEIYYDNTKPRTELRALLSKVGTSVAVLTVSMLIMILLAFFNAKKNFKAKNAAVLELSKAHDELEARVRARTLELSDSNEALNQEIATRRAAEEEKERLILELTEALKQVKTLTGLLPMCSSCQQIRDAEGKWSRVDEYIQARTNAEFTHGICPKCAKRLYPDLYGQIDWGKAENS